MPKAFQLRFLVNYIFDIISSKMNKTWKCFNTFWLFRSNLATTAKKTNWKTILQKLVSEIFCDAFRVICHKCPHFWWKKRLFLSFFDWEKRNTRQRNYQKPASSCCWQLSVKSHEQWQATEKLALSPRLWYRGLSL